MSRDLITVVRSIVGKLHPGWVLARRGGVLDAILSASAGVVAEAEAEAVRLMDETDPRNARDLLADFERVLGPDHCGRDLHSLTVNERLLLAHQRWTSTGGQSIPYMISVAAKLGVPVEAVEYWPSTSGIMTSGDVLIGEGEQFTYTFKLEGGRVWLFHAGGNVAGDPLGSFTLSPAECELRRIKPAHTEVVFNYIDLLTWEDEPLLWDGDQLALSISEL